MTDRSLRRALVRRALHRPPTRWSVGEVRTIKREYGKLSCEAIGKQLNRTVSSVTGKALRLGLVGCRRRPKWTKEMVAAEARRYQTRLEFQTGNIEAYRAATRKGWLPEVCAHMPELRRCKWTKAAVIKEATRYRRRSEFQDGNQSAYQSARRNGWLDEACAHMDRPWNGVRKAS